MSKNENRAVCKGHVFRANVYNYITPSGDIGTRKQLRRLKRRSCSGCEQCAWILEALEEDFSSDTYSDFLTDIEHGKVYQLTAQFFSDPYDFLPADGDVEFELIEIK